MTELEKLKLLCDIPAGDTDKDSLLLMLLSQAKAYLLSYCRVDFADESMTPVIVQMAAEDYGRLGGEGLSHRTVSGAAEGYRGDYSPKLLSAMRRYRRLRAAE